MDMKFQSKFSLERFRGCSNWPAVAAWGWGINYIYAVNMFIYAE